MDRIRLEEGRRIYFIDRNSVGRFNERQYKLFAEMAESIRNEDSGKGYVSVYGGLGNGFWDSFWSTYSTLAARIESLVNDERITSIALLIDSPGGMAEGLMDFCSFIEEASKKKPINAYITGMACSAAYAIAVACDHVYGIEGGETGCCGCYAEALEVAEETYSKWGFLHRVFRSANAPKKNRSVITDKEAEKAFQQSVDESGARYLEYVASRRGVDVATAEETFGKGAVVSMEYALENGMVDGICPLEEFMQLTSSVPTDGSEGEDMDIANMSAESIVSSLSAEQTRGVFDALCTADPSLLEERMAAVKESERQRVAELDALRDGSEEVDAIVDAAVKDGRNAQAIGLDIVRAMKAGAQKASEKAKAAMLETLMNDTTPVATPSAEKSEDEIIDDLASRI